MKPFTVLVINSALGFETTDEYTTFFRLPVSAFYEMTAPDDGHGTAGVESSQAADVSETLYDLYRMVKSKLPPGATDERPYLENLTTLKAWSRTQLTELRQQLDAIEQALSDDDDEALYDRVEQIRETAEGLAFSAFSVDAVGDAGD